MTLGLPAYLEKRISPEPNSGCWLWDGALTTAGYGSVRVPEKKGTGYAHIEVYKVLKGPIPQGLQLDHGCRVRCCCNPDHVEPVTQAVNLARGFGVGATNASKTNCAQGHSLADAYIRTDGGRACRECNRQNATRYYRNKKGKI